MKDNSKAAYDEYVSSVEEALPDEDLGERARRLGFASEAQTTLPQDIKAPFTVEHYEALGKPATGQRLAVASEWTAERVQELLDLGGRSVVAGEHNAALTAAEEKYENATDNLYRDIKRLNQQLTAERESHEKELGAVEANWSAELSDTQKKLKQVQDAEARQARENKNYRYTIKLLLDMLKSIRETALKTDWGLAKRIDDTLDRV